MSCITSLTQKFIHRSLAMLLLAALCAAAIFTPGQARPTADFTVDTPSDGHDAHPGDGICDNGAGGCSLRSAIEEAFFSSGGANITFWSILSGYTIQFSSSLGTIQWAASDTTVDGETNNISLSGEMLTAGQSLFRISGSRNTLENLVIRNVPANAVQVGDYSGVGEGNSNTLDRLILHTIGSDAVYVYGGANGGGLHNALTNSLVGVGSWMATTCVSGEWAGGDGVHIEPAANDTHIVGNRIVCSTGYGIHINGSGGSPDHTTIDSNDIGGYASNDMGNLQGGILDWEAGSTTISHNVISGNDQHGVWLRGSSSALLEQNHIGVSTNGSAALPNGASGVMLSDGAHDNQIGGYVPGASRNVISGNSDYGVYLNSGSAPNLIESNLIGLNADGTAALPNGLAGVAVNGVSIAYIGSSTAGAAQFISGNGGEGVLIQNSSGVLVGLSNWIGLGADGTSPIGNGSAGVLLMNSPGNSVQPALLAYNAGPGAAISGDASFNNRLWPVQVHDNGGIPLDLGYDGPTDNGTHTPPGPDNWLEYPVITSWTTTRILGTTCNGCTVRIYRALGNTRAAGGGGSYLMEVTADGTGSWSADLPVGVTRTQVTLVACQAPCGF